MGPTVGWSAPACKDRAIRCLRILEMHAVALHGHYSVLFIDLMIVSVVDGLNPWLLRCTTLRAEINAIIHEPGIP